MTNKVLLNNVDHADLKLATGHGAAFGDEVNQMLVFPTEFGDLQREFPILFSKDDDGAFQSVALLGFDRDENLFLGEDGWRTRYVPAIQQRGPFSIVLYERQDGGGRREPMVHVDLDDPRVGSEDGEPLFLRHGGNSPRLEQVTRTLQVIHSGQEMASTMFAAFAEVGLIEPVRLEIKLSNTEEYVIPERYTIAAERLAALDGARLERLNASGFLQLAFHALSSLGNIARLIELKNEKRSTATPDFRPGGAWPGEPRPATGEGLHGAARFGGTAL